MRKILLGGIITVLLTAPTATAIFGMPPAAFRGIEQDKDIEKAAMRLYKNALRQFQEGDYWNAMREFVLILDYYEHFSAIDGVLYHLGESLYEMKMFRSSDKIFRYLTSHYPQSRYVPRALFGLQRIHYNVGNYKESLRYYLGLTTRYRRSDVIDGAYYYGGMSYFHQKDYDASIRAFSHIRARSEYFEYGLYTVGLAFLKKKASRIRSRPFVS